MGGSEQFLGYQLSQQAERLATLVDKMVESVAYQRNVAEINIISSDEVQYDNTGVTKIYGKYGPEGTYQPYGNYKPYKFRSLYKGQLNMKGTFESDVFVNGGSIDGTKLEVHKNGIFYAYLGITPNTTVDTNDIIAFDKNIEVSIDDSIELKFKTGSWTGSGEDSPYYDMKIKDFKVSYTEVLDGSKFYEEEV